MEKTIKNEVKHLFSTLSFENALEATRELRGEYIKELGVKSWNGLVSYYKRANIQPKETLVAEPEPTYDSPANEDNPPSEVSTTDEVSNDTEVINGIEMTVIHPENVGDLHDIIAEALGEAPDEVAADDVTEKSEIPPQEIVEESVETEEKEVETVDYMIYRNIGDVLDWFGHKENYTHLSEGTEATIIRGHSYGVGNGMVVAVENLTYYQISIFHRCYNGISKKKCLYKEKFNMAIRCFRNIALMPVEELVNLPKGNTMLIDYVLDFTQK